MPLTFEQHEKSLENPPLCELLPIRDYLENVMVRTDGNFVGGYELRGLTTYFASDEGRDRGKIMLEALLATCCNAMLPASAPTLNRLLILMRSALNVGGRRKRLGPSCGRS
jgi:hypothetical protein